MATLQFKPATIVNDNTNMPYQFLNLFTYHNTTINSPATVFNHCKMMKTVGNIKIGTVFDAIVVNIELQGWQNDNHIMDENVTI